LRRFLFDEGLIQADLVLLNAKIYTMEPSRPTASALAILGDRIIYVGDSDGARQLVGPKTKVVDLEGKTVIPGLIDTHVHMMSFGRSLGWVDLRDARSVSELVSRLRERAESTPAGRWIVGYGWDQERFVERRYPTRWDLDEASEEHPIVIYRTCLHLCVANSLALQLAGISRETQPPEGGVIELDETLGEPNGVLRETAMELVRRAIPRPSLEEAVVDAERACREAVKHGLTSVHWIMEDPIELRALQRLRAEGRLPLRVYAILPVELAGRLSELGIEMGFGDEWLRIGAVKLFLDGSLGARTAALKEPYSDKPDTSGRLLYGWEELRDLVLAVHRAGLQLVMHAIGDKAIEMALSALENALNEYPSPHRHRIEHVSVLNEHLLSRMAKLKVLASVQPHFVVSDFWVDKRLGPRRVRWVYAFKSLLKAGISVSAGSDCPVEPINPFLGIEAAVNRKDNPEEALSVEEALRLYTINAAYASGEENLKGSIAQGKLADFVILDENPFSVAPEKLGAVCVLATIVGGRPVYLRESAGFEF